MSSKLSPDLQLKSIIDALTDSLLQASDEELREDAALSGIDLEANAASLRQMFRDTAKSFQKRKFAAAKQQYEKRSNELLQKPVELPEAEADRRQLLQLVVAQCAQRGIPLTAKFRDFEGMSDNDLKSLLEELAALGVLPKRDPSK